ncbi:bifunctional ADP-dependent NAD(P)H-hydrate dehydratase/NAD(P)H-hydrate epimerase [Maritimibacter sp. 55A14]|uniref:NAD(P)H-hydrate dehydratase n=1 Tax=Maritimibacter sp. 55A14 TaxID=2174844 RepID=UPI000D620E05|nr:NAD(P)H-hydrate dehydratase [Maritimibacter sp. 55A14]PWE30470.1 bifunctional ADP-dependent NAD(P)H-hydrate dehydratase/NAD(P)H-hydrate epimerase [Maritimibacter sp. 55A14]
MTELLTAAQMRAIEEAAIGSGAVTGLELMERAGRSVVEAVFEEWPDLAKAPHRAVVLCGPGNNGGDGFVVARLLKAWGWEVEVFLYGDPAKLPPDAKVNYERCLEMGEVDLLSDGNLFDADGGLSRAALWVDALFGTGLTRPLSGPSLVHAVMCLNEVSSLGLGKVVACDVPSGLCADSGRKLVPSDDCTSVQMSVNADFTVSFHSGKIGHRLAEGPRGCGKTVVKSIGLEGGPRPRVGVKPPPGGAVGGCPAVPPGDVVRLVEGISVGLLAKAAQTHKYAHGHALILVGGAGRTGAARLAARGALRIGAGLVTLGVPGSAQQEVASQITALMLRRVEDGAGLAGVLGDARINALCLGPGMGMERARELVPAALRTGRAVVLDADALTGFSEAPEELFRLLHENCVITPHAGEFARLFPDIAEKLNATPTTGPACSKVDATREAAARAGCAVLFKGPDTVIAAPDGRCSINSAHYDRAAPWLATAGAGDVLAGFIAGLLARRMPPMQAAEAAAWLHVECARRFGPGLIAEDLPETLPGVLRDLGC